MLCILIFLILVACTGDNYRDEVIIEEPPIPTIESEEGLIQVLRGSYCWKDQCIDAAGAPEIFQYESEDIEPHPVTSEEELSIQMDMFPDDMEVSTMVKNNENWEEKGRLSGNTLTAHAEEGIYYYQLFATWGEEENINEASVSYFFLLEVE